MAARTSSKPKGSSSTTKPKGKPANRRRPTSRQAPRPTEARKTDKGVPDDLEQRYRAGEQGAGSTTIADELDQSFEDGLEAGRKEASKSSPAASSSPERGLSFSRPTGPLPSTTVPMVLELLVVTVDEILTHRRPPIPSRVGVVVLVFGALGMARGQAARPAAAVAWGLVIASIYASSGSSAQAGPLRALTAVGNFIGGQYATGGPSNPIVPKRAQPKQTTPGGPVGPIGPLGPS